jgi:hypothetical protein
MQRYSADDLLEGLAVQSLIRRRRGRKFELAEAAHFGNFVSHFTLRSVNRQLRSQPPATFLNTGRHISTNLRLDECIGDYALI